MPVSRRRKAKNSSRKRSAGGSSAFVRDVRREDSSPHSSEEAMRAAALRIRELIDGGIQYATSGLPAQLINERMSILERASRQSAEAWLDPRHVVAEELMTMISNRWEQGWQPVDLIHYLRRRSPRLDDLGAAAIRRQLQRAGLDERLPDDWALQLDQLGHEPTVAGVGRASWLFSDPDPHRAWVRALLLMDRLRRAHPIARVGPPPSEWERGRQSAVRSASAARPDGGLLNRVRALLAKAESTNFAAEAEALTAKAQDLITRHSIDEALLFARSGEQHQMSTRRLHLDNPYSQTKALLVQEVAEANQSRAIWDDLAGASTVIGTAADLEQVELLVTSLLVQATRAMTDAARGTRAGSLNRSPTFRRSFLSAYATRIGERLAEVTEGVASEYGAELVPVLAERKQAVDDATRELFPNISSGGRRTVDLRGWQAGTNAADDAVLPRGRLSSRDGG